MTLQRRRRPRDDEEIAAFNRMGQAIITIRERRGMDRDKLAAKAEMTRAELEAIERGELDEWWGGLRVIANAFDMPLDALMVEAEEVASGPGGDKVRQSTQEDGPKRPASKGPFRIIEERVFPRW